MSVFRILPAFSLTLLAGLSTVLGSAAALPGRGGRRGFLPLCLSFSAGVMLYISLVEILPKGQAALGQLLPRRQAAFLAAALFLLAMALTGRLQRLLPAVGAAKSGERSRAEQTALFTALVIGLHNFPEGLVTFLSALDDPCRALPVAFAIAVHNVPEGVAVAVTVRRAGGSPRQAVAYAALSGLAEPAGALLGWLLLRAFLPAAAMGILFAPVAGIMVYLALFELLPAGQKQPGAPAAVLGGMALMALSLLLLPGM